MRATLTAVALASLAATGVCAGDTPANAAPTLFGRTAASVTYGPYVRFELGRSSTDLSGANWVGPGPADPRVFFNSTDDDTAFGGAAIGFDWMNGFRADVGLFSAGKIDATGTWSHTVPTVAGPHADITAATVRTTALMGSFYYAPLEQRGVNSRVQPYLVAGLGLARNEMSDWTRTRASATTPVRTFEGKNRVDLAYSVGVGVAVQVTRPSQHPVLVDLSWRYYDFGTAKGGTASVSGAGGTPREALSVDRTDSVLSLGIRVPLRRY